MSHFRFQISEHGAHVRIAVYVGVREDTTHGQCGVLTMSHDEAAQFLEMLALTPDGLLSVNNVDGVPFRRWW